MILTYADMGEEEKAKMHAQALLKTPPDFTVSNWQRTQNCLNDERLSKDRQSLLTAGLPDGEAA